MATAALIRAYRAERKHWHGPVPATPALNALRAARWTLKKRPVDCTDDQEIALTGGWTIRIRVTHDDGRTLDDMLGTDVFEEDNRRYSSPVQAGDGWVSRDGQVRIEAGRSTRGWFSFEAGYPYADRVRDARRFGLSRHDAWLSARRWTARQACYCREILDGSTWFYGVIVTLRDADGTRVADESCGGFDSTYPVDQNDMVLGTVSAFRDRHLDALTKQIETARHDATARRARAAALDVRMRTLFADLKAQGPLMPSVCLALRDQIRSLREQRKDARRGAKDARCRAAHLKADRHEAQQIAALFRD